MEDYSIEDDSWEHRFEEREEVKVDRRKKKMNAIKRIGGEGGFQTSF